MDEQALRAALAGLVGQLSPLLAPLLPAGPSIAGFPASVAPGHWQAVTDRAVPDAPRPRPGGRRTDQPGPGDPPDVVDLDADRPVIDLDAPAGAVSAPAVGSVDVDIPGVTPGGPPATRSGPGVVRLGPDGRPVAPPNRSALLVARAQRGDPEAFGQLYDLYVDVVFRFLAVRLPDRATAEDLTSETFVRALRRLDSFSWQGRDVGAWLLTIARNLVTDHYKSARSRLETVTDDVAAAAPPPLAESPEAAVLAGLDAEALLAAVRRLGADQQEVVALRFLQGLSVAETAEVMHRSAGAVKTLQYRALKSLAALLAE